MTKHSTQSENDRIIRLEEELRKRDQQIALFKEVVTAVRERFNLDGIFQMVAAFAQDLIQAETVLIPVLDESRTIYTYRAGCGLNAEEIVGESLDLNLGICGWVWKHQRPWWRGSLDELDEDERNRWEKAAGSTILVPLVGRNHFLGGIACINKLGGGDFDRHDLDLLVLLASQVAIAIDNNSLIEQLELANQNIFNEKERAEVTLACIGDAVISTDTEGRVTFLNQAATTLTGWPADEASGKLLSDIFHIVNETTRQKIINPVDLVLKEGKKILLANHTVLISRDGTEYNIEESAAPIYLKEGSLLGCVLVFHDVTEKHRLLNAVRWQAGHDGLTGLPNRALLADRFERALASAHRQKCLLSICLMDLDGFKLVNDRYGHELGDQLLVEVAGRLTRSVRGEDTVARLGGDEFVLLLGDLNDIDETELALKRILAEVSAPYLIEGKTVEVSASIGVSVYPLDDADPDTLLRHADQAMYQAKQAGRHSFCLFEITDN